MNPSTPASDYSEDATVERPAIALFAELGWETGSLYQEWTSGTSAAGREGEQEVILARRLRLALERLNPSLPASALDRAVEQVTLDRSRMVPVNANRELYGLLKDGVKVPVSDARGRVSTETVRLIDWRSPEANDFFIASQFWVSGELGRKRADVIGFVNGIPLLFCEFKSPSVPLKSAYDGNLTDYRHTIPHLFIPNALILLSNGSDTRIGSTFASWQFFNEWKRINDEGEKGVVSLETVIRGVCAKDRLLDIVENFTVFEEAQGGLVKKVAKNHQYLGVNRAIGEVLRTKDRPEKEAGRLGVFWHTQGSGKSLSMLFFCQKILRTIPGNWTFVLVTDREELDDQIYKTFAATGAVTEKEAHATSGKHLQQLLQEDHRYIFTLIHKFNTRDGTPYPRLSERRDIIVITDEAHRTQYDTLALNMRNALPYAAFLGFTGTPLMAGEERTKEVFGDYISVYNFAQSIADGATVPLYYENRIPELQLINDALGDDLEKLLEEAELDEAQERKVQREFAREYHLITRDDRLEAIAEDLVKHFVGRGFRGKAMMICIDKATAVRMYDKVQTHWRLHLAELKDALATVDDAERALIETQINAMETTDMAVVVSQGQNEVKDLDEKGLDIRPHRKRMMREDLDEKFKDPDDQLRLVFVCAMWITGFDVPSCSTLYLDKPMKNHTLMQTIARANRTFPGKEAGLIVDYVGVFKNLQKALSIYGNPTDGDDSDPIKDKRELVEYLKHLISETSVFCGHHGVELDAIKDAKGFEKVALLQEAVEALIENDETKRSFLGIAQAVARVYKAILPDASANEAAADAVAISVLAQKIKSLMPAADISAIMKEVEDLLDRSVAPIPYGFPVDPKEPMDISQIDFEALRRKFAAGKKRTEAEKLRALLNQKLMVMVAQNPNRTDFLERFQRLIEAYNSGSRNIEDLFDELVKLAQALNDEDQRAMREGLTEEELALFDILTKPEPELTEKEKAAVKRVCKALLETLKQEKLVIDWRNKPKAKADVRLTIEKVFDDGLPEAYDEELYATKCSAAYRHVFDAYNDGLDNLYATA